jgi:IPT/TIG domain
MKPFRAKGIVCVTSTLVLLIAIFAGLALTASTASAAGYTWTNTNCPPINNVYWNLGWAGGSLYAGIGSAGVLRYNPATGVWTDTGGGIKTYLATCFAWDGSYLYAGTSSGANGNGVWRYDPVAGIWTALGGPLSTYMVSALTWNGSVLYVGTSASSTQTGQTLGHGVWKYDPKTSAWTDTSGVLSTYQIFSLAWDGSGLYAAAFNFNPSPPTYKAGVFHYDPGTGSWTDIGSPVASLVMNAISWDGSGLYASIITSNVLSPANVWRYNPKDATWKDTLFPASACQAMAWDGSGLFAGTANQGVLRYDPVTATWANTDGAISTYSVQSLAWDGSGLYAAGNQSIWHYGYTGVPNISAISPTSAWPGAEVTIQGTGFGATQGSSSAYFGSTKATSYSSWSDTEIKCKVPTIATGNVQVSVSVAGKTSNVVSFTVTQPPAFQVTSISPNQGSQLDLLVNVTVEGTGFQPGATAELRNGTATIGVLNVNVVSDTQITGTLFLLGVGPGNYDVVVVNPGNQEAKLAAGFKILNACGQGAAVSLVAFGFMLGLFSLAGSGISRRRRRKNPAA